MDHFGLCSFFIKMLPLLFGCAKDKKNVMSLEKRLVLNKKRLDNDSFIYLVFLEQFYYLKYTIYFIWTYCLLRSVLLSTKIQNSLNKYVSSYRFKVRTSSKMVMKGAIFLYILIFHLMTASSNCILSFYDF